MEGDRRDVIKVMTRRFQDVTREFDLNTPMYRKYGRLGWLTLASIVEKEAAVPSEQNPIAGVFYNRLVQGWSLGADLTVRFAVRKPTGPLFVSDLNNDSPYNTRKFTGLPPGPNAPSYKPELQASPDLAEVLRTDGRDTLARSLLNVLPSRNHASKGRTP